MMTLQEFLEKQFDEELMLAVLSGQRSKEKDAPSRVRIRPIELKGSVCYQASSTVGTKVLHSNYTREEIISMLSKELNSEWTNGVTCLMVENSDSYIPVIVHHNKNELIVEVGEQDKKIYRIGRNELNKTS